MYFLEWRLGTYPEADDIFPPVKVGTNETGSAAIVHGKLQLNENPVNKTVAEFHKQDNQTMAEMESMRLRKEREKAFFSMEPGRCVFQTLYAIGWSHQKSKMKSKPVCIKRKLIILLSLSFARKHKLSVRFTHLRRMDSSTTTLRTSLFPTVGCLISFYSNMTLTFSQSALWKRYNNLRRQRSGFKRARLVTSRVNIYFC